MHTDPQGKDIYDRLKAEGLFFTAATENLAYHSVNSTSLNEASSPKVRLVYHPKVRSVYPGACSEPYWVGDSFLVREIVDGWLKSPGHRVPILDRDVLWESVGIGIVCGEESEEKGCYVTAVFASFESESSDTLPADYFQYTDLYSAVLGFDYASVAVNVKFNSSERIDFYIVPNEDEADRLEAGNKIRNYVVKETRTKNYSGCIDAKPGYGIIVSNAGAWSTQYTLKVSYVKKCGR